MKKSILLNSSLLLGALTLAALSGCSRFRHSPEPISGPIAGNPVFNGGQYPLAPLGYQRDEYFFSGTAVSYKPAGTLGEDGRWSVIPGPTAPFTSRMVVIRPTDPAKFNGTVVVEWLNVTSGSEVPAEWTSIHRELLRQGYAYVAVSAQSTGIEGGSSYFHGGKSLKLINPTRYASLHHPGDAYSYDIFSQAARHIRGNTASILGSLKPLRLIAIGESQSATFLVTYVNAIDPLARIFDAFLIHSRLGFASGLGGAFNGSAELGQATFAPVRIRADARVPVLITATETDLLSPIIRFNPARQPDSDQVHTWQIAGTAHADNYLFGLGNLDSGSLPIAQLAAGFRPIDAIGGAKLEVAINAAPQHHYVEEAAISALNRWLTTGSAPPSSPILEIAGTSDPKFVLDANGNVRGGIRSPWVDVPTSTLSGLGQTGGEILALVGTTKPFTPKQLHTLYPKGKEDYLAHFQVALQSAISAGFILDADQQEIQSLAAESWRANSK